jgi:hypothetical protein
MTGDDLSRAQWKKSSYSGNTGNCVDVAIIQNCVCVEVSSTPSVIAVRDSTDPHGPALAFAADDWQEFLRQVKHS